MHTVIEARQKHEEISRVQRSYGTYHYGDQGREESTYGVL